MRWQLADHIDEFDPWRRIAGRKAISLEEAYLLERFGIPGYAPEAILIETMAHFCRWLAVASSGFKQSAVLSDIISLHVDERPQMGDIIHISATVVSCGLETLECDVSASIGGRRISRGRLGFWFVPLQNLSSPDKTRMLWREIHGEA